MLIVDAQIHLWNAGNPTSPWHRQIPAYLKEDALKEMAAGGVDAAILTPHTPWDPNANELCMEAARAHPDRFAILGNFPLDKPESRALVDTWKQRPGMLGCRFTFIGPDQSQWPTDGTVDWLWPAAERAGLPIAMMAANFLPKVAEVAQRHPNLKLILDHLGRPILPAGEPYCPVDGLIYPAGATRCDVDRTTLLVRCPKCEVVRAAGQSTCGNCGLKLNLQPRAMIVSTDGPPPGGAAIA